MTGKILQGMVVTVLIVIVPTLGNPAMIRSPHIWILVVVGVLASIFQPKYNPFKSAPDGRDKGTASQIIWSIYLTQLFMLIEASYFRYPGCVAWDNLAVIGLVLMVSGLAIRTWAVMTLGSFFTWHIATQADQKVITSGPYAFVRHPGYFGPFLTYVGTTIFFHSWIACFLSVVFLLFAFLRRIHHEEKELTVVLGREYADYCRAVKRFIPFVW